MPKIINVRKVNTIVSRAKVSKETLTQMQWLAFDGYMTYLNDHGGGPEIYEDKVYDHIWELFYEITGETI